MSKIDFTQNINNVPLKWKKHLLLVEWGIREKENLINSINRYYIQDYLECLNSIKNDLEGSYNDYSFVIKLVYKTSFWKLPNLVIRSIDDLEHAKEEIEKRDKSLFSEIWYCKNKTENNDTVFGRMLIDNTQLFPQRCPIKYELVWGTSARDIELYPNNKCPFVSVEKTNWNSQPVIIESNNFKIDSIDLLSTAKNIIKYTSQYKSIIIDFASFVFSCGCNQICFEFCFCNGDFYFIDWDTDNDVKVLRNL